MSKTQTTLNSEETTITRYVALFASSLGVDDAIQRRASEIVNSFDGRRVGTDNGSQKAALSALSLASKERFYAAVPEDYRSYYSENVDDGPNIQRVKAKHLYSETVDHDVHEQPINQTEQFCELMDEYGLDPRERELRSIERKMKKTPIDVED